MKSRWFELKEEAIKIRKKGVSIGYVEKKLGIPRSTLSGWFKDIQLTKRQKGRLCQNWKNALVKARKKAIVWHNQQKERRMGEARKLALNTLEKIDLENINILELTLSVLYLGEGFKTNGQLGVGNSDPTILKFFIRSVGRVFKINPQQLKCELHLRADQNGEKIKRYWSRELKIPQKNFLSVIFDKRTVGIKTYPKYKGVCIVRFCSTAHQRRLVYLSNLYCEKVINNLGS